MDKNMAQHGNAHVMALKKRVLGMKLGETQKEITALMDALKDEELRENGIEFFESIQRKRKISVEDKKVVSQLKRKVREFNSILTDYRRIRNDLDAHFEKIMQGLKEGMK